MLKTLRGMFQGGRQQQSLHKEVEDYYWERLQTKGYDRLGRNIKYKKTIRNRDGEEEMLEGQLDIFGVRTRHGRVYFTYYEIKCNDHPRRELAFISQVMRLRRAYPHLTIRGVYATRTCVKRI